MRRTIHMLILLCMSAFFAEAQMWPGIKSGNNPLLSLENKVFLAGTTGPLETGWNWESVLCYDDQNVLSYRYTQTFDAQGHMLTQFIEKQTGNVWTNYIRVTFSWLGGTLISGTTAMWTGSAWQDAARITEAYDGQHRVNQEVVERNSAGIWINDARRNYSYTFGSKKLQMLQENWENNAWINDFKNDYVYDLNGYLKTINNQFFNDEGVWENNMRLNYTCDAQGHWLEMIMDYYDFGNWAAVGRITYTTDTQGNILGEMFASKVGNSFVNEMKKTYTCDNYGNSITGKSEALSGITWVPDEASSYIYKNQDYLLLFTDPIYRWEATYKAIPLGMEEPMVSSFSFYPNPADDILTIQIPGNSNGWQNIQLFDMHGREVNTAGVLDSGSVIGSSGTGSSVGAMGSSGNRGSGNYTINTSALTNGLYFITIYTEKQATTQKIVVCH